jgi:hypothetical protein
MSNVVLYATAPDNNKYAIKCSVGGELSVEDKTNPISVSIHTGNLGPLAFSTAITLNNLYKNSLLTYQDTTAIGLNRPITIWGSTTTDVVGAYQIIGTISPTALTLGVSNGVYTNVRFSTQTINLGAFKFIKIRNELDVETPVVQNLVGIKAYLYSA